MPQWTTLIRLRARDIFIQTPRCSLKQINPRYTTVSRYQTYSTGIREARSGENRNEQEHVIEELSETEHPGADETNRFDYGSSDDAKWKDATTQPTTILQLTRAQRNRIKRAEKERNRQNKVQVEYGSLLSSRVGHVPAPTIWAMYFPVLNHWYGKRITEDGRKGSPILHTRTAEWVESAVDCMNSNRTLDLASMASSASVDTAWLWMQICLWLMANDPSVVLRFLDATYHEAYVLTDWVRDTLAFTTLYHLYGETPDVFDSNGTAKIFLHLIRRGKGLSLIKHPTIVYTLITECDDVIVKQVYQTIQDEEVIIHHHAYLHFAEHFAKSNEFDLALRTLLRARDLGAIIHEYAFLSNCATILRKAIAQPDGLRLCMRVVDTLINIGVKLNAPIRDIIMLNAVDIGDANTAFSVHSSLMAEGVTPTETTFHILLRACQINIDDAETLNQTIRSAIEHVHVRESRLVAETILFSLAIYHAKHHPTTAYRSLVEAYSEMFDPASLQEIGLPWPTDKPVTDSAQQPMPPSRHAMVIMVRAYVQHIIQNDQSPTDMIPIYRRWRELVEAGNPLHARLADSEHMANAFLIAFISSKRTLPNAAHVVRDMQRPLPSSTGVEQSKPTIRTWCIFLLGFTRYGQTRFAEQLVSYMRSKGIEPNLVAWNTLIHGYAQAQDVRGTRSAILQLEESGRAWDEWTRSGVRALRDQGRLREELRQARTEQNVGSSQEEKGHPVDGIASLSAPGDMEQGQARKSRQDDGGRFVVSTTKASVEPVWSRREI